MKLFDKVPANFFSVLSSSKKELYADVLLEIRRQVKEFRIVDREILINSLKDMFENRFRDASFDEEMTEEGCTKDELEKEGLSGKVSMALRRLEKSGWIEWEQVRDSFSVNVSVPDYAMTVLNAIYDLVSQRAKEYTKYVFPTYVLLKHFRDEENLSFLYQTLQSVYENTENLYDRLIMLKHNIRRYLKNVITGNMDVNELLKQHFDLYYDKIVESVLNPILTFDSVRKFKGPIIQFLSEWYEDETLKEKTASQAVSLKLFENEVEAMRDTEEKISKIIDDYRKLPAFIDEIMAKHSEYMTSSIEHIRYLSNTDRSIRGNLIKLLRSSNEREVYEKMADIVLAFRHSYADSDSLYFRSDKSSMRNETPLSIKEKKENEQILDDFLKSVRNLYGNSKVDAFVLKWLGDGDEVSSKDMDIKTDEEFVLFLLGTIRGREHTAPFSSDMSSQERIIKGNFVLPEAKFLRKKGKERV